MRVACLANFHEINSNVDSSLYKSITQALCLNMRTEQLNPRNTHRFQSYDILDISLQSKFPFNNFAPLKFEIMQNLQRPQCGFNPLEIVG